jgi:hypothetical protein
MRLPRVTSLGDRHESLLAARQEAEAEVQRLAREEEFLVGQVRQAREQVRYYEELLAVLKRDWGKNALLADLVRKLG